MANDELDKARIDELGAEALYYRAEAKRASTEEQKLALEARELERDEQLAIASEFNNSIYSFIGAVDSGSVKSCMSSLGKLTRINPETDITIIFNSPGGNVIDGLALFDSLGELREKGHKITTVARGMAASMGGILLQAGDERVIGANAHVLIHEISSVGIGSVTELEDEVKFLKRLQSRCLHILAERSTLSVKQVENRWKRKDWWLDSEECVEYGFADRIG